MEWPYPGISVYEKIRGYLVPVFYLNMVHTLCLIVYKHVNLQNALNTTLYCNCFS